MAEIFNIVDRFFAQKFMIFWLNEMYKVLDMLYYLHCSIVKNLLPILKNQNGVYIQSLYSLMKLYKHFLKDFELVKYNKMLPSMKFQNGAHI
jgi:hypothetical protein